MSDHHFRSGTQHCRADRLGIEHVGDRRLNSLLRQTLGFFRRASQDRKFVSVRQQLRDKRLANGTRSSGNENLHDGAPDKVFATRLRHVAW
jgi:hypothetical protein